MLSKSKSTSSPPVVVYVCRGWGPARAASTSRDQPLPGLPVVVTEGVVPLAGLGVGQDVVGLGHVLDMSSAPGSLVDIGVVLAGQLSVSPLDLVGGSAATYAQDS